MCMHQRQHCCHAVTYYLHIFKGIPASCWSGTYSYHLERGIYQHGVQPYQLGLQARYGVTLRPAFARDNPSRFYWNRLLQ